MTDVEIQYELRQKEVQRVLALASAVRDEYGCPWSALSPLEMAECFVTSMRADGWRNKADILHLLAPASPAGVQQA